MTRTQFQIMWAVMCWGPLLVFLVLRYLESKKEETPPGPPGSIEYIRWQAGKEYEALDEATKRTIKEKE